MSAPAPSTSASPETITDAVETTVPIPTTEQLQAALDDVEYRIDTANDPDRTKYLRGVRDTLRTVLGVETDESNPASIIILEGV